MKIIYGGHWTTPPEGWVSIPETEQDLTKPLNQSDESVDVIFTEHVLEHISFVQAISFFKEAYRVLKPGGILRTVCPFIDQLVKFDETSDMGHFYAKTQLKHYYPNESHQLDLLDLEMIRYGLPFMMDSLLKKHNHQFVWSTHLMVAVLSKLHFKDVTHTIPGKSWFDQSNCLERTLRGIDPNDVPVGTLYDPESLVVEAKK